MIRREIRAYRFLYCRERIAPMSQGSLLSRCLGANGSMTSRPGSALDEG
jgi:hypothetical protein